MNNRSSDRKVSLGIFGKPFGLKGFVYFRYYGDDPKTLIKHKGMYLSDSLSPIKIEDFSSFGKKLKVKIIGVEDRDDAENLRDKELLILQKDLPKLQDGEFYLFQLENLNVVNEEKELLGKIDQIMKTGANDVLVVKPLSGSVDKQERLIPFSKDEVIREVDIRRRLVYVKWPKDY